MSADRTNRGHDTEGSARPAGAGWLRADLAGTAVTAVITMFGLISNDLAKAVVAPVSFAMGAVGVVTFLWSYFAAVERSRTAEISVSQLYTVAGSVAPRRVKRLLMGCLWAQVILACTVMGAGFGRAKPEEFNWAACAIVVPLLGFGLNGMWVARHGTFGPRIVTTRPTRRRRAPQSRDANTEMEQNQSHG